MKIILLLFTLNCALRSITTSNVDEQHQLEEYTNCQDCTEERKRRLKRRPQYGLLNPQMNPFPTPQGHPQPLFQSSQVTPDTTNLLNQGYGFHRPVNFPDNTLHNFQQQQFVNPSFRPGYPLRPNQPTPLRPGSIYPPIGYPSLPGRPPYSSPPGFGGANDLLSRDTHGCVPRMLCEAVAAYSGNDGNSNSRPSNVGGAFSLLAWLTAVAGGQSPLALWGGAVAVGSGGNSKQCHIAFPQCPADADQLLHYFNHNRGQIFGRVADGIPADDNNHKITKRNNGKLNEADEYESDQTKPEENEIQGRIQNRPMEIEAEDFFVANNNYGDSPGEHSIFDDMQDIDTLGPTHGDSKIRFESENDFTSNYLSDKYKEPHIIDYNEIDYERDNSDKWIWQLFKQTNYQALATIGNNQKIRTGKKFVFPEKPFNMPHNHENEQLFRWKVK